MLNKLDNKEDRFAQIDEWWKQATTGLQAETENIKKNFQFYCGGDGQWDKAVIAQLNEDGKPHLSINKCKSVIDLLSGYQRKFRNSLDVFPRRGGTAQAARVLTQLGRHTMDVSRPTGDHVQSETFMMGALGGKWWSALNTTYEYDIGAGDLQPESVSCFDVLEDPIFRGYDINSNDPYNYCRYIFRCYALTREQLDLLYPDNEELGGMNEGIGLNPSWILGPSGSGTNEDYEPGPERMWRPSYDTLSGKEKRYWIRQCWYKKFETKAFLLNQETGQVHPLGDKVAEAKKFAKQNPILAALVRIMPKLYKCDYLDNIELKHEIDPFKGLAEYPFFRFCPYWIDGRPMGELDNLQDAQMELNKRRSQLLHHLNQSANSGWIMDDGSVTEDQLSNFQNNSSRSGFVGVFTKGEMKPEKIVPSMLSEGHLKIALLAREDFEDITKLNDAVYGQREGGKESGTALNIRREQGLAVKESAFDNFKFTELALYSHLLERIRRPDENGQYLYRDHEIMLLVEEHDLEIDIDTLRSMETGRYGIKVARSETQPTVRRQNFLEFMETLNALPAQAQEIDIVDILESSDLSNKTKIIESIQKRRQQIAQAEQQQAGVA